MEFNIAFKVHDPRIKTDDYQQEENKMKHAMTRQDDNNQFILMLVDHYPKCFFEEGRLRRPLKQDIIIDIKKDTSFDVTPEKITAAVQWYQSHIGYDYNTIAGAKRIDLQGRDAGTVTEQEALAAKQRIDDFHKMRNEKTAAQGPVAVLNRMYTDGRISDDSVKKLDAPPLHKTKATAIAPEFAALYETLTAASSAVVGISDPTMRAVVVLATLDVVIQKCQQVRSGLTAG
jgi:sRNA-binding protein